MGYPCGCCSRKSNRKIKKVCNIIFENMLEVVIKMSESEYGSFVIQTVIITVSAPLLSFCI